MWNILVISIPYRYRAGAPGKMSSLNEGKTAKCIKPHRIAMEGAKNV